MVMLANDEPIAWTIRRIEVDYAKPARLDDDLEIHTRYRTMTGARLTGEQWVKRDGVDLVTAKIEAAHHHHDRQTPPHPRRRAGETRAVLGLSYQR